MKHLPEHVARAVGAQLQTPKGVSLVMPAYNEEDRIGKALDAYLPVLGSLGVPYEVIVVMDGDDGTPAVVERYKNDGVVGYHYSRKLGKGGAIINGFTKARYGIVGYVDADGSLDSGDLLRLVRTTSSYDCVIASRWSGGSKWRRKESPTRIIASRGFNFLVRGLLSLPIRDTQSGAKFYSASLLEKILPRVTVTNLTTDVDFLYHAKKEGARMCEVPVTWDHDDRTKFGLAKMIAIMSLTLLGIRIMNLPIRKLIPDAVVSAFQRMLGNI